MKLVARFVSQPLCRLATMAIRLYQWTLRPLLGPRCRFVPHCSDYAIESYQRYGFLDASWLTAKRLGRCHPWCQGGLDPVPQHLCAKSESAKTVHAGPLVSQTITSK